MKLAIRVLLAGISLSVYGASMWAPAEPVPIFSGPKPVRYEDVGSSVVISDFLDAQRRPLRVRLNGQAHRFGTRDWYAVRLDGSVLLLVHDVGRPANKLILEVAPSSAGKELIWSIIRTGEIETRLQARLLPATK